MVFEHDWKNFPELSNSQMDELYFLSPHKQITENIRVKVIKVHDGDTITVQWNERDFNFPVRIVEIDAPELNRPGGHRARDFLKGHIEGDLVELLIDPENRVEKWGRLLADVNAGGFVVSELMLSSGHALPFERRRETELPLIAKEMNIQKWLPR